MSTRFVHTGCKRPPVDVEWQSAKDPWAWRRFVDFMWQEGYVIYEEKKDEPSNTTEIRLEGEIFSRQQVEDVLKEAGAKAVEGRSGRVFICYGFLSGPSFKTQGKSFNELKRKMQKIEDALEVIRGNRQA